MLNIYIDYEPELFDYSLEDYANLDNIALFGNSRNFGDYLPKWYTRAAEIMQELDTDTFCGENIRFDHPELSREQRKALVNLYKEILYIDDKSTILSVLAIIEPEKKYVTGTITGNAQGEWKDVICLESEKAFLPYLADLFFGYVYELHTEEEDETVWSIITSTELFEISDNLTESLLAHFDYAPGTPCQVFESDGYTMQKKWKAA